MSLQNLAKGKWISGAIKRPGSLVAAAAKRNGRSKLQEAEVESHSKNPHVRGRGLLGKRFLEHTV